MSRYVNGACKFDYQGYIPRLQFFEFNLQIVNIAYVSRIIRCEWLAICLKYSVRVCVLYVRDCED
jgi:hypothetical protein